MRNWKNWLFPILTCLTVAALALLPLRLSVLEDGKLTETVHAEPLSGDSNFPFKPPDLPGRVWLLVQWQELPDQLAIMSQELEGADREREMERLRAALEDLGNLLTPTAAAQLAEADGDSWEWNRYYLRDQSDLSSAGFTEVSTYDKARRSSLSATLDGESGQLLSLHFRCADGVPVSVSAQELGGAILDRLGLEYEPAGDSEQEAAHGWAAFRLPACKSWFYLSNDGQHLDFNFSADWEAVDAEAAEMYGYPVSSHGPTDADLMQKR